jgi:hypothetical protein
LPGDVDLGRVRRALHPAPPPARELARRGRCAVDDRRDLLERQAEHVVQHECEPLRRGERLEHDEQRGPDRVGEHGFALGVDAELTALEHLDNAALERVLAPRAPGAKHVETDPGDDGRQPTAEVVDVVGVGAVEADPRLLHRVVGLGLGTKHPVRHRAQVRPVGLEPLYESVVVHVTFLRRGPSSG